MTFATFILNSPGLGGSESVIVRVQFYQHDKWHRIPLSNLQTACLDKKIQQLSRIDGEGEGFAEIRYFASGIPSVGIWPAYLETWRALALATLLPWICSLY